MENINKKFLLSKGWIFVKVFSFLARLTIAAFFIIPAFYIYGEIHNISFFEVSVSIKRDIIGKVFRYSTLIIEDTSEREKCCYLNKTDDYEIIGFYGNKIFIPGLKTEDAEKLKDLLMQKIQENPEKQTGSGL